MEDKYFMYIFIGVVFLIAALMLAVILNYKKTHKTQKSVLNDAKNGKYKVLYSHPAINMEFKSYYEAARVVKDRKLDIEEIVQLKEFE